MARKAKTKPATAPASAAVPAMPLFESNENGVLVRLNVAGNQRLTGFKDAFGKTQEQYDRGASATGKAREMVKELAETHGFTKRSISLLRQFLKSDPAEAIATYNDLGLLMVDAGIFDAAEETRQAEEREANAASVAAAERANAPTPAPIARRTGEPPATGPLSACFYQGDEAFKSGAPIDDCPTDYSEDKAAWWREGFLRAQEAERPARATTSAGKTELGRAVSVLALDLGANTGWAIARPGRDVLFGTQEFAASGTHPGAVFQSLRNWLHNTKAAQDRYGCPIERIVFERVAGMKWGSLGALESQYGMKAIMLAWACHHGIPVEGLIPQTIKARFAGDRKAKKPDMIARARALGHDVQTEHEADAIGLLYATGALKG